MTPVEQMRQLDTLLSHVWMVRAFLKHSEEAAEDDELAGVHRELYDYMLALGGPLQAGDTAAYFKLAKKKFSKLRQATELFREIQPEVSSHTNFQMAAQSLSAAVQEIGRVLQGIETRRDTVGED
ncbi:MAG TPA: amidohydrolase [Pirellulaceae bacterium]|nr:amidohydrolase [Pirellulaceae bacterium]